MEVSDTDPAENPYWFIERSYDRAILYHKNRSGAYALQGGLERVMTSDYHDNYFFLKWVVRDFLFATGGLYLLKMMFELSKYMFYKEWMIFVAVITVKCKREGLIMSTLKTSQHLTRRMDECARCLRYGTLTRWAKLRVVHAPGISRTFSLPPT